MERGLADPVDNVVHDPHYQRRGVLLQDNTLFVDITEARTLFIKGINPATGQVKDYLLRVSDSGRISVV